MPARLRPVATIAADAILVGDPGRALALAQALLERPLMCNHARGLWGYTGTTADGVELTVQSTGMGAPSATTVLADLAELGVRRAIRVGTCTALDPTLAAGDLLLVAAALRWSGGGHGDAVRPDTRLTDELRARLGATARPVTLASLDVLDPAAQTADLRGADAADMQTAGLLEAGTRGGVAVAALAIVAVEASGAQCGDEELAETAAKATQGSYLTFK